MVVKEGKTCTDGWEESLGEIKVACKAHGTPPYPVQ